MESATDEAHEVHVPTEHVAVVAMFSGRDEAETAVDALLERGFTDDQISLVARGAGTDDPGAFVPGGMMVTISAENRQAEAERVLKEKSAARSRRTGSARPARSAKRPNRGSHAR